MKTADAISHIWRDERGVAWVDRTNVKVIEVVLDHLAYGWSADAIHEQHPHLSLAQIHAALAFYFDHQTEFDELISQSQETVTRLRESVGESPLQRRLRSQALAK